VTLYASTDDGRSWQFKRVMTGFQRVNGHLAKLRDGRVLFTYGDRASDFGKRGLEAMISADGGEAWSKPVRLVDWNGLDGGYPSSVQRKDGQIVTAYYSSALPGEPPNSYKGYHMAVIVWDAEKTFTPFNTPHLSVRRACSEIAATAGCAMRRSAVMAWKCIRHLSARPTNSKP